MSETADLVTETAKETSTANEALEALRGFEVQTPEQINIAGEILVDVKGRFKQLEERLQEITKPLNAALKSTRDLFRPAMSAYEEAEVILKQKIAHAHLAIAEANRLAMLAAQAQMAQGNVHAAALAATSMVERPTTEGVRTRESYGYRIVNALLVPREFLVVDDKKIKAHIAAHGDKNPIPGVVVEKTMQVVAARGR